jgi:hypothetical protein
MASTIFIIKGLNKEVNPESTQLFYFQNTSPEWLKDGRFWWWRVE